MASLNHGFLSASSHTHSHFLDSSVHEGVHDDLYRDIDAAFYQMNLAQAGPPGTSLDIGGCHSSLGTDLQSELELASAYLALHSSSASVSDDAAAYAYVPPASLSCTPEPDPFAGVAYDLCYLNTISPVLQSATDMHELPAFNDHSWMTRGTIPVESAYSTIVDALGCCPADVFAPPPSPPLPPPPLPPPPPSISTASVQPAISTASVQPEKTRGCPKKSQKKSRQRKNTRIYEQASPAPSSSPYPSSPAESSTSTSSRAPSQPDIIPTMRRNAPAFPASQRRVTSSKYECPHCDYVQRKRRGPDIRRHIETHKREAKSKAYMCCGVPLADAEDLGVPVEVMGEDPVEYEGILMVGGCRKTFSRKDALGRHLRKYKGKCFGDVHAPYLLGNKRKGGVY